MKINRAQFADIFGVAKTTVETWRKNGCPVESVGGKCVTLIFDSVDVFIHLDTLPALNSLTQK